jgi:hypothetical protein
MPEKRTMERARRDRRAGKSPSTQAGEFVREEIEHIREGKHGAKNAKQAIAIGLSKARRAGVKLGAGKSASPATRKKAAQDRAKAKRHARPSRKRSRAVEGALERQPRRAASKRSLSRQAKTVAHKRSRADRSRAAKKAARTRKRERSKR